MYGLEDLRFLRRLCEKEFSQYVSAVHDNYWEMSAVCILQAANLASYEARPKIEVVKAKMRGSLAGDTKMDDDQSNQPSVGQAPRLLLKNKLSILDFCFCLSCL